MTSNTLLWLLLFGLIGLMIYLVYEFFNQQYIGFVMDHSIAIKELQELNSKYEFYNITNYNMSEKYDNEFFYGNISPKDYLTYQLVYKKKEVSTAINNASENRKLYKVYINRVNSCELNRYNTDKLPKDKRRLIAVEKKCFNSRVKHPTTSFTINVCLVLTKINGTFLSSKTNTFNPEEITEIIERLKQKNGDFYLNDDIWQSICRVERGRVSNRMRFAIYKRDGYRCRKCGCATQDLEIDHIFPISKGGKSTYDNLQTLCHRCNALKSNTIEAWAVNPTTKRQRVNQTCGYCGAPLVRKSGKYGDFYSCSNYPKCRFTKQLK